MTSHFSAEEGTFIAKKYRSRSAFVVALIPIAALFFTRDIAAILAIGFSVLGTILILAEARLHDIWTRLGRTNTTLSEDIYPLHLDQLKSLNLYLYHIANSLDAETISNSKSAQRRDDLNQKLEDLLQRVQQSRPEREGDSHEPSSINDQKG
jgi:hypothetical protein